MSHELRTPLNAIIGVTEMLREDVEAAKQDTEPLDRVLGAEAISRSRARWATAQPSPSAFLDCGSCQGRRIGMLFAAPAQVSSWHKAGMNHALALSGAGES
jgi:signal transduction histidine kinase